MDRETRSVGRLSQALTILANPTRAAILRCLEAGPAGFTELLDHCMLDMHTQSGLLDHHLQHLLRQGLIAKSERTYSLTKRGVAAATFLAKATQMADSIPLEEETEDEHMKHMGQGKTKVKVEKFTRGNLEGLVDFWIERFEMKPEDRDRVRKGFEKRVTMRGTVRFLAWDAAKVVGFLAGRTVPLTSRPAGSSKHGHRGVLGYIESVVVNLKTPDAMDIMGALVDAHEKYFRSKSNCKGSFVPNVTPELDFSDRMLLHVLQEKGFFVQNINYQMRKDFQPGLFMGPITALKEEDQRRIKGSAKQGTSGTERHALHQSTTHSPA